MTLRLTFSTGALVVLLASPLARAHFPILIHDGDLGATNGSVTVTYAVGHPFELEMEPAERPDRIVRLDGKARGTNVTGALRETRFRGITNATAWQLQFEPSRGDSWIAVDSPPTVDRAAKSLYREYVKVCVHRAVQDGWANRTGQPLEIVPLTRPYGLVAGMTFAGRLMRGEVPMADAEVYFERLSERPPLPREIPAEPLVTFAVRTDRDGRFVLSLPDPGWWVMGAYLDDLGTVKHDSGNYRHEGFAGLWVKVEPR